MCCVCGCVGVRERDCVCVFSGWVRKAICCEGEVVVVVVFSFLSFCTRDSEQHRCTVLENDGIDGRLEGGGSLKFLGFLKIKNTMNGLLKFFLEFLCMKKELGEFWV